VSWISLKGRCRECKKKIGYFEPLMEIGVATFFVLSYTFWPSLFIGALPVAAFIIWLIAGVGLAILFAYDVKWLLLPDKVNIVVIGLGLISAILYIINAADHGEAIISVIASVGILSGLYLFLYVISKGKWIGFGDVKLGLGLGLLLGDWQLAFIGLFAANLIGTLIVIPSLLRGEMKRNTHVPFGPLLIAGTVVAQLAGPALIGMYVSGLV
jgi:prepilin signal peptidase PulO-like enzyme (type II secretory pathway)